MYESINQHTGQFSKWWMTVALCFTFSQELEGNGKGNHEIKYSLGMPYKIKQKFFGCQCPLNSAYNVNDLRNVRVIKKAIHLKQSQSSLLEHYDGNIADQYASNNAVIVFPKPLLYDGTNACAFLRVKIADEIITTSNISNWHHIVQIAETVITTIPGVINDVRDRALYYNVMETYSIMKDSDCLKFKYEFSEELPYSSSAFSQECKTLLLTALGSVKESNERVSIYTCEPYTFVTGSKMYTLFNLDTHPVPLEVRGQNSGILKTFFGPSSAEEISKAANLWLWKRLSPAGEKKHQPQSLSIMQKDVYI